MARRQGGAGNRPRGGGGGGRRRRERGGGQTAVQERQTPTGPIEIPAVLTVAELSELIGRTPVETIKLLMRRGVMATVNEPVDFATAAAVADHLGIKVRKPQEQEESIAGKGVGAGDRDDEGAVTRPPVVAVLGHVDHGKTTLLDRMRGSAVAGSEAGGITQSIGAYQVEHNGQRLTFVDTPGHEAFTTMRARGAQVTDIVVLVVAADDGIMPQTVEAIDHAKAAGVPIVVAINKIDVAGAEPERVKRELAERNLLVEDWGGEVVSVEVSALKGTGIDDLLDNLLLVAELQDLKANPEKPGTGVCIEAHTDRSRGPLAAILVRSGKVKIGDDVVIGVARGRIRDMSDAFGSRVEEAGPSTPVEIMGLDSLPEPGDLFQVVESERAARDLVEERQKQRSGGTTHSAATLAEVMRRLNAGDAEELPVVIKTGTQGSIDAVRRSAEQISDKEVQVNIIHSGTGSVNESDVMLAAASGAIIMAFDTGVESGADRQAQQQGVEIRNYDVIYNLIDDIRSAARGLLSPIEREVVLGHANVQAVFPAGRRSKVAGVRVTDGQITRRANVRVYRGDRLLHTGRLSSLRHFKDDVRELNHGYEGGIGVDGFDDWEEGDVIEAYEVQLESRA